MREDEGRHSNCPSPPSFLSPPLTSPWRWGSHYITSPPLPFPLPRPLEPVPSGSFKYSPPTRPSSHQTKLIHTFSVVFFATLPPLLSPFRYPTPSNATTGSVVYTWEDDRPFTKLRPIYEPATSYIKSVPSARGQRPQSPQQRRDPGIGIIASGIPEDTHDADEYDSVFSRL